MPYLPTSLPPPTSSYSAEIVGSVRIKNQDVLRISKRHPGNRVQIVSFTSLRGAGLAPVTLDIQLPNGKIFNLLGSESLERIQSAYEADAKNPYRDNLFFKRGIMAPLYPLANRLLGQPADDHRVRARVKGVEVVVPLNNQAATANAIPHHLHGLIFGETAQAPSSGPTVQVSEQEASVSGDFEVGPALWAGKTQVTVTETLNHDGYFFRLKATNVGKTPVPVGAGGHPYFTSPEPGADAIRVHIPARKVSVVNNLNDVLPTGKLMPLSEADPALNFSAPQGEILHARSVNGNNTGTQIDHLWTDLEKDSAGYAYAEVIFSKSRFRVRLTALTQNVIGIQGYAPKHQEGALPFVALELVTNLPDPREELWKEIPTGMTLLHPGESFEYGYKIEVFAESFPDADSSHD